MADGVKGDIVAHEHTYEGFLRVFRMGAIASFAGAPDGAPGPDDASFTARRNETLRVRHLTGALRRLSARGAQPRVTRSQKGCVAVSIRPQ